MIRLEVSYEIKVKTIDLLFQHYCYLTPLFNIFFRFTYVMASLSGSQEGIGSTSSDQSQENSNIRLRVAERSRTSAGRRFRDVDTEISPTNILSQGTSGPITRAQLSRKRDIMERSGTPASSTSSSSMTSPASINKRARGFNTRMMLFALTEQELRVDFQVPLHILVKIRLAKQAFDRESSHVQISAGLLGALPEFRGTGPRGMDYPSGFLIRFEAVLESANVQRSRWSAMLTLCLTTPEDTTYWRAYLNMNRDLEWREYRANFLKHFEKYDQRSKYIEQLH